MDSPVTCTQCGKENPPQARFCMFCAARLTQDAPVNAAASTERRVVSIVFADIVGSTSLAARMDAESVRDIIAAFFSAMRDEVSQYGGIVEKFVGDAVMAVFGLPQMHEDDAERAVRTAAAMQNRMTSVREQVGDLHIRIGIGTGEVVADADAARSGEFMVTGETVNLAARLQQEAPPDAIVVDERTRSATMAIARYEPLPAPLTGVFANKPRWRMTGIVEHPKTKGLRAPLLGRTDEVQLLLALYQRVVEREQHHLVTLIGNAGVGKTRLAEEVLERISRGHLPAFILRGRCPAYGDGLTYWPLAEMVKHECHILDSDSYTVAREKLEAGIRRVCDPVWGPAESGAIVANFGAILGLRSADRHASLPDLREGGDPRSSGQNLLRSFRAFLSAKARSRPLVLLFEDLQRGEKSLLELLEHLTSHGVDAPILMVCLARPELFERWPEWGGRIRNYTTISLAPLSSERSRDLITALLDGEPVPADVKEGILAKADGNPFFIGEILRMLVDSGSLVHDERGWRWAAQPVEIHIPDTVHGIVASRLDLLTPLEKRVIQDASIAGRIFWLGAVVAVGSPAAEAREALARLQERELVERRAEPSVAGEEEFAFRHALIPEVAYRMLPKAARAAKHLRFAEWLEGMAPHGDQPLELLAHHYEQAWRYRFETGDPAEDIARKAIHTIRTAGARARNLRTLPEARHLYERALRILYSAELEKDRPLLLELLTDRSEVVKWLSAPDVVFADTQEVIASAPAIGRSDLLARAWLNRAFAEQARGELQPAEDALRRAGELFRTLHDRQGEAETLETLGIITEDLRGKLTAAREAYGRAQALYRELGDAQGVARTRDRFGWCVLNSGRLDEAERILAEVLRLAQQCHERISEADAVKGMAIVAHLKGNSAEAIRLYQMAITTCLELGDLMGASHGQRRLGVHYLRVGQLDEAERALWKAQALRAQHGATGESAGILRGLAETYLARGDLLRAAEHAERAVAAVPEYDELARATHGITLGRVRASQGRADEAKALFQRHLPALERGEYVIDLAIGLLKYGEALLILEGPHTARPYLERARALFAQMNATFFTGELDARLAAALP